MVLSLFFDFKSSSLGLEIGPISKWYDNHENLKNCVEEIDKTKWEQESNSKHWYLSFFPKLGRKLRRLSESSDRFYHALSQVSYTELKLYDPSILPHFSLLFHMSHLNLLYLLSSPIPSKEAAISAWMWREAREASTKTWYLCWAQKGAHVLYAEEAAKEARKAAWPKAQKRESLHLKNYKRLLHIGPKRNAEVGERGRRVRVDHRSHPNVASSWGIYLKKQEVTEGLQTWSNLQCAKDTLIMHLREGGPVHQISQ